MDGAAWCLIFSMYVAAVSTHKRELKNLSERVLSCEKGWHSFQDRCYKLGENKKILRLHWGDALRYFISQGGTLATIGDKETKDFLSVFFVLEIGNGVWIGFNDIKSEGKFYWEDGSPVTYTNWAAHEPSHNRNGDEDCVEMRFHPSSVIGEWSDDHCGRTIPFICQKDKSETPVVKVPLDAKFCSEENNSGWKLHNSCFNLVVEKKTWSDAEDFCQNVYHGHLVTLRDVRYDLFVDYILRQIVEDTWIGIRIKETYTQKWSSGWFVSYSGWKKKKKDFVEGTCAIRHGLGKWGYALCTRKFSFICESTTDIPPVLTQSVKGAVCPDEHDDWRDLGGDMCYFIESESLVTWYKASFICMQRGGNLASIHSKSEVAVLEHFLKYAKTESFLIGLYSEAADPMNFLWSDHTPYNFKNWDVGEPSSDTELCSVIFWHSLKFHDHNCEYERGYICAIKKVLPKTRGKEPVGNGPLNTCPSNISPSTFAGVIGCILFIEALLGIIWLFYLKPRRKEERKRKSSTDITRQRISSQKYRMRSQTSFDVHTNADISENET